jgi:hypothetical protein
MIFYCFVFGQCGKFDETKQLNYLNADIIRIPLSGDVAKSGSEISGLTWYKDQLILLPQYPDRFSKSDFSSLFRISKEAILDFLDQGNPSTKISPERIKFDEKEIPARLPRFQGYEAIAFVKDKVYLTIELNQKQSMQALLIEGSISEKMDKVILDETTLDSIPVPLQIGNHAYESLVPVGDKLLIIYEANGVNLTNTPQMVQYDLKRGNLTLKPFINLEYRITDATSADEQGKFWVINYFWPGDVFKLMPAADPLADQSEPPIIFSDKRGIERLVELQYADKGIKFTDSNPIILGTLSADNSRNWEGVVRLDDKGFIVVTDRFPETILAFVPF